jgi:hypothetical protein
MSERSDLTAAHPVARGTGTLGKRSVCAALGRQMTAAFGPR